MDQALVSETAFFAAARGLAESFDVQVFGDQPAPLSGQRCAYWEWAVGQRHELSWSITYGQGATDTEVELQAGGARARLPLGKLRTHLAPTWSKKYDALEALPPLLAPLKLTQADLPLDAAEYCLLPQKTYFGRLVQITIHLPPEGQADPLPQTRELLLLSDAPILGQPQQPVKPHYQGCSY